MPNDKLPALPPRPKYKCYQLHGSGYLTYFPVDETEAHMDAQDTRIAELEREIRVMMALGHGHEEIYGDDGELQCHECGRDFGMWDYAHEPLEKVRETYRFAQIKRMRRTTERKNGKLTNRNACTRDPSYGWSIVGPYGSVGFSAESCQRAFEDWQNQLANNKIEKRS